MLAQIESSTSHTGLAHALFSHSVPLGFLSQDSVVLLDESGEFDAPDTGTHLHRTLEQLQRDTSFCMSIMQVYDPSLGRMVSKHIPCGNWRNHMCERCFARRASKYQVALNKAVQQPTPLHIVRADDRTARQIVRKYGKDNCMRLPQSDGGNFIFVATPDLIGEPIDQSNAFGLDWNVLANTPQGKNISGKLQEKEQVEAGDSTKVSTMCFLVTNLDPTQIADAEQEAYESTSTLDPHTDSDLKDALKDREAAFVDAIEKRGGEVIYQRRLYVNVILSGIDWINNSENSHRALYARVVRPYYESWR